MMQINVHSQNLRGCLTKNADSLKSLLDDTDCECTAICLQDIGPTAQEGPPLLRFGEHHLYVNFKPTNKARTVAIILHKSWRAQQIFRDSSGSAIGVVATRAGIEILIISAYLPPSLDKFDFPDNEANPVQLEAHHIYSSINEWIKKFPFWLLSGDLNETRSLLDRFSLSKNVGKKRERKEGKIDRRKFINVFLEDS